MLEREDKREGNRRHRRNGIDPVTPTFRFQRAVDQATLTRPSRPDYLSNNQHCGAWNIGRFLPSIRKFLENLESPTFFTLTLASTAENFSECLNLGGWKALLWKIFVCPLLLSFAVAEPFHRKLNLMNLMKLHVLP